MPNIDKNKVIIIQYKAKVVTYTTHSNSEFEQ